jgi:hypothetical protein
MDATARQRSKRKSLTSTQTSRRWLFETGRSQVGDAVSSSISKTLVVLHAVSIACCVATSASDASDVT